MGGSGGYFSRSASPERLRAHIRAAESQSANQGYESAVAEILSKSLAQFNDRDVEGISRILDEIKEQLGQYAEGSVNMMLGGSVAKHTYVDGLSDIDALVIVHPTDAEEMTPADLRKDFAKTLISRYGRDAVQEGTLAVTLNIEGHSVQLIPVLRSGRALKIGNETATEWSRIQPKVFAESLTSANRRLNMALVPTIKLAKAIIGTFPEQRRMTGYHVEAMALRLFNDYSGVQTPKAMLQHFFENAPDDVQRRIRDVTGQSQFVDAYLGEPTSLQRRIVADALGRVARIMKNADGAQTAERWSQLLAEGG